MNVTNAINEAENAYINYRHCCEVVAREAKKYIDWNDAVSCEYMPSDGLCILATLPNDCEICGMPECVCPADLFFEFAEASNSVSPKEFKSMCI